MNYSSLKVILTVIFSSISILSFCQTPSFVNTLQGPGTQEVQDMDRFLNGDMLIVGELAGTVDFDPSAAVNNLSSAGLKDIYVARYTMSGALIWAFRVGAGDEDGAFAVVIDNDQNFVVTGYFRGTVDFDPGVGTSNVVANSFTGTNLGYGGDIFVAKYSPSGNHIWSFGVGGDYWQDAGFGIDVDDNDNIYVVGAVNTTSSGAIDFDPGVGVFNLAGSPNGLGFIAKYSSAGNFTWAFCVGQYGLNSAIDEIQVVPGDTTFVVTGHFIGTNTDFDPGPGVANISTNGFNDIVLAKYSLNNTYMWAFNIGGPSPNMVDQAIGLKVDNDRNNYITGYIGNSNVDFDPGPGIALKGTGGGSDVFLAKYNEQGNYVWAHSYGAAGTDWGFGLDIIGNSLITTGFFENTVDFDPGAATHNLVSAGGRDIYVSNYDTAGNFQCAFQMGGTQNEFGRCMFMTGLDSFYIGGGYFSNPIDFDPGLTTLSATNSGGQDGYWGLYEMGCPSLDTIINHYAAVQSFDTCTNAITVDNASDFSAGDTILMIQMKGAIIDSSNTAAFGNITNYNNAGNYEENIIQSIAGNVITLRNNLLRTYSIPDGKVQIVSIPQFTNYTIDKTHTSALWDGNKGGVLAMNVTGTLTMDDDINVNGKGFRGGIPSTSSIVNCNLSDYFYPATNNEGGEKGEGIAEISLAKLYGRGKQASGGGGGNSHNAGGAGGGNGGAGGLGGNQYNYTLCPTAYIPNLGGLGGSSLNYSAAVNKIFLGGGGGCGHANNQGGNNGGNGGGLTYVKATNLISNNASILANGDSANYAQTILIGVNDDGGNGGGAGGTVLLSSTSISGNLIVESNGGNGSDAHTATTASGPGGGGGGGAFWFNQASIPTNITFSISGGQNGVVPQISNTAFGSQAGQTGQALTGLNMPLANMPFVQFNTINAGNDTTICNGQSVQLNATGAVSYSWSPNTGLSNANIANPIATPSVTTSYIVTGIDANGCIDMDTVVITVSQGLTITVVASQDTICAGDNVTLTASGADTYSWTGGVINANVFSPTSTATYTVTGTDVSGCTGTATYTITVLAVPNLSVVPTQPTICAGDTVFFNASGAQSYEWSPATFLSNQFIPNPISLATSNITYTITGTNGGGCDTQVVVNVIVNPVANIIVGASKNPICIGEDVTLTATGGVSYSWTGGVTNGLPFSPASTQNYTVTGTTADGCVGTGNISVTVNPAPVVTVFPDEPILCAGDSIWLNATGALTYLWSPSSTLSAPNSDSTLSFAVNDVTYTVIGVDGNGCRGTATLDLNVIDNITLEPSKSADIYCEAIPIQLAVKGGSTYTWSPAQLLSNPSIANPMANITETTTFYVTSQLGSCFGHDSITVFYYDNSNSGIFIPNAFSPNGDGLNDCYRVISKGNYTNYIFRIYNRWGQMVFESRNPMDCWNGNFGPDPVPIGTYFYYIRATGECGEVRKQGDINVLR